MIWLSTLADDEFKGEGPNVKFRTLNKLGNDDSVMLRETVTCPGHIHTKKAGHLDSCGTSKNVMLILSGIIIAVWFICSWNGSPNPAVIVLLFWDG